MTRIEVNEMVKSIGIPSAYYQFKDESIAPPPFLCFYFEASDDFIADGINYAKIDNLVVELYTDEKDFALEATVEAALTGAGLAYQRNEDYIGDQRLYMTTYTMEVFINA